MARRSLPRALCLALALAVAAAPLCLAEPPDEGPNRDPDMPGAALPTITVVGSTPLVSSDLRRDQIAAGTEVIGPAEINRTGVPSLTGALLANLPSAVINDTEGNVFQPDLLFRGFTASPVAGTPQGLAVYVNGARFNDAFGDTVNWDLIPPSAIAAVSVEGPNPIFGLNALGGSVNVRLKNGFTEPGADITAYGGSYGRGAGIVEFGTQSGAFAFYAVADVTHDGGFRQTSTSDLYRLYTDFGWRADAAELHLALTGAHDRLGNPGATPVQALAANLANIFTAPNVVDNKYFSANLNGTATLGDSTSLQGVAYFHRLDQYIPNGITEQVAPCDDGSGLLCNDDGSVVTTTNGQQVPDFLNGATYSGLSVQNLYSHAYGASLQITETAALAGRANHLVAGASYDGSDTVFVGSQALGGFDPYSRAFLGPGVILDQPDQGVNPVRVASFTHYYGLYATDVVTVVPHWDLTLGARFNSAQISLEDRLAGPVNGQHGYTRVNPTGGVIWHVTPHGQLYASYSETNRAPTPQELSCASAATPCSLLNFFVGDPDLHQVVARTVEAGWRGEAEAVPGRRWRWDLSGYLTRDTDDIIYESTVYNPNLAYYTNAGRTRRQGIEAHLRYDGPHLHVAAGYAYTDATFQTALVLNGGSNPAQNDNGQLAVQPGNRLPGIPRHRANVVVDYDVTGGLTIGASATTQSSAYRFGDEANLTAPVGGYTVVDLNVAYRAGEHLTLFALVNNVLDRRYYTYGAFGPVGDVPWPNVPGGVTDPSTASPGVPRVVYGGVKLSF